MKYNAKLTKSVVDRATKRAVDGIIDILLRAYSQYCKLKVAEGETPTDFRRFADSILSMSPKEFSDIPIMSKAEYYGE